MHSSIVLLGFGSLAIAQSLTSSADSGDAAATEASTIYSSVDGGTTYVGIADATETVYEAFAGATSAFEVDSAQETYYEYDVGASIAFEDDYASSTIYGEGAGSTGYDVVYAAETTYIEVYGAETTYTSAVVGTATNTPLKAGGGSKSFIHLTSAAPSLTVVNTTPHTTNQPATKTTGTPSVTPSNAASRVDGRPSGFGWVTLLALPAFLGVAVLVL